MSSVSNETKAFVSAAYLNNIFMIHIFILINYPCVFLSTEVKITRTHSFKALGVA